MARPRVLNTSACLGAESQNASCLAAIGYVKLQFSGLQRGRDCTLLFASTWQVVLVRIVCVSQDLQPRPPLTGVSRPLRARNPERVSKESPGAFRPKSVQNSLETVSGVSKQPIWRLRSTSWTLGPEGPRRLFGDSFGIPGPEGPGTQDLSWHLSRDRRQDLCDRKRLCLKNCFAILWLFSLISGHAIMVILRQ